MKFINQDDFHLESYKITPEEFYQKKKDSSRPIFLDIRPLDVSSQMSIEGSYSLPAEMFNERLIQLPPFGVIILYSDKTNSDIKDNMYLLWENGFSEIFYVDGGFDAILSALFKMSASAKKNAAAYIKKVAPKQKAMQVIIKGRDYSLVALEEEKPSSNLFPLEFEGFKLYINPDSQRLLLGSPPLQNL